MPRLLILAPTFFPDPTVAAIRVSQWARWLPEFGWSTHVACRHYGHDATPEQLAEAGYSDTGVSYLGPRAARPAGGSAAKRAGRLALLKPLLEAVSVPDVSVHRWRSLRAEGERLARDLRPDVVLSSSPPHSIHWLGRRMARAAGARWVVDFRDPTLIDVRFGPTGLRRVTGPWRRAYDRGLYRDADLAVHAIPLHARWARRRYAESRDKVRVLLNGAPPGSVDGPAQDDVPAAGGGPAGGDEPNRTLPETIRVRSVGHLADDAPRLLAEAFRQLEGQGLAIDFRHVGTPPAGVDQLTAADRQRMAFLGRAPHADALRLVAEADLLLACLSEDRSRVLGISSKLFEYLATGTPILAVNPTRSDRRLLREYGWCETLSRPGPGDVAAAVAGLLEPGRRPAPAEVRAVAERFDRRRQTRDLADWLNRLID